MQIQIQRAPLLLMAEKVQGAIEDRTQAQVGLKAEDQVLTVSIVDKAIAVYCTQPCEIVEGGTVFIPAKLFIDIVKELPSGTVVLRTEDSCLVISAGPCQELMLKIPLIDGAFWRKQPELGEGVIQASLPCAKIAYMIDQVQFCIAQECPRNYGTVGYLHQSEAHTLRLVGSDGFRLSYCDIRCELPKNFLTKGVCIPKRALGEFFRMCHEGSEKILCSISNDQGMIALKVEGYELYFLLSTIKYPNYLGVIPTAHPHLVDLQRTMMQSITKRVLLAADKIKSLQLEFSSQELKLSARNIGSSEGRECVPIEDYNGPSCSISVNGRYFSEVFATSMSEKIALKFDHQDKPIVIVPAKEPQDCFSQHILVPLREGC